MYSITHHLHTAFSTHQPVKSLFPIYPPTPHCPMDFLPPPLPLANILLPVFGLFIFVFPNSQPRNFFPLIFSESGREERRKGQKREAGRETPVPWGLWGRQSIDLNFSVLSHLHICSLFSLPVFNFLKTDPYIYIYIFFLHKTQQVVL